MPATPFDTPTLIAKAEALVEILKLGDNRSAFRRCLELLQDLFYAEVRSRK
jgi:hypothetical protein